MTTDYNILTRSVPLGGNAFVPIGTKDDGALADIDEVRVKYRDHLNILLVTMTYTGSNVSATDIHGEPASLINPPGTGTYEARLRIDPDGAYSPPPEGLVFTVEVYAKKGTAEQTEVFSFRVMPSTISIDITGADLSGIIRRKMRLFTDKSVFGEEGQAGRTIFYLGKDIIYGVEQVYKNGTIQAIGTNYEWFNFRPYIRWLDMTPPSATDHLMFRVKTGISDEVLAEYINEASSHVLGGIYPHYENDDLITFPTVVALICNRVKGKLDMELSEGVALESARFRSGREAVAQVEADIAAIQRGEADVLDNSFQGVTRVSHSQLGSGSSGKQARSRRELLDQAQQWTSIYLDIPPEREIPSPRTFS